MIGCERVNSRGYRLYWGFEPENGKYRGYVACGVNLYEGFEALKVGNIGGMLPAGSIFMEGSKPLRWEIQWALFPGEILVVHRLELAGVRRTS